MIQLLAKLGRSKTVAIITVLASILATILTAVGVTALNRSGFDIDFELAIWFAV